jgi:predicted SnoaL-like aldol condensation-catalyzing enzyme
MKSRLLIVLAAASVPVFNSARGAGADQQALLKHDDPKLAANKKLVYDFFRIVLQARHLDEAPKYMKEDYMQHNPNAETGMKGFIEYFQRLGGPTEVAATLPGLIAIQAEGDYVTLSFVREYDDPRNPERNTDHLVDMLRSRTASSPSIGTTRRSRRRARRPDRRTALALGKRRCLIRSGPGVPRRRAPAPSDPAIATTVRR